MLQRYCLYERHFTKGDAAQSDLLPKEGTKGAEIRYKEYAPREYLSREERTDGQ